MKPVGKRQAGWSASTMSRIRGEMSQGIPQPLQREKKKVKDIEERLNLGVGSKGHKKNSERSVKEKRSARGCV